MTNSPTGPPFGPPPDRPGDRPAPGGPPGSPGAPGPFPPAASYGPPPGPYQPAGGPVPSRSIDGPALAGFLTAIIGVCWPLSVVLNIVGIVRTGRSGERGRGLAIAGLVLNGIVAVGVLVAVVLALASSDPPERDPGRGVTERSSADVMVVERGDCLADLPSGTTTTVELVPCNEPHEAEAVATFRLADGPYPAADDMAEQAEEGCVDRLSVDQENGIADGDLSLHYLHPQPTGWEQGDREVICLVATEGAPLTDSLG